MKRIGQSKKLPKGVSAEAPLNPYYEAVSDRYGVAQVVLYLVLLAFVAVSFLGNTGLITYENLYYFVKDLNASAEQIDVLRTDALSYPASESPSFTLYRQGLAVAGNTSVTVFSAGGRQTVSSTVQYQMPTAVGSGKYLLVYDLGGTSYSLYNSYTQIHAGTTAAPIRAAAMSESGTYAIVTESATHASCVDLYDSDFRQINQYTYRGYVTDLTLQAKGSYLAVLVSEAQDGAFSTYLRVYEPGKGTLFSEATVGSGLGLRCGFTESGDVAVLCGDGIRFLTVRGKTTAEYSFEGNLLTAFDLNENGCMAVLKKNRNSNENYVIVFDKNGEMVYNDLVGWIVEAAAMGERSVFLLNGERIQRIRWDRDEIEEKSNGEGTVRALAVSDDRLLLCSTKRAVYCKFNS